MSLASRALRWLVRRAVRTAFPGHELRPRAAPAAEPATAPDPPAPDTLEVARQTVIASLEWGSHCPCCGQYAKAYKRALYDKMARWLGWCVRAYEETGDWLYVGEGPSLQMRKGGGDFAKLAHWGLIEPMPREKGTGIVPGWWRPTNKGIAFVRAALRVPSHVYLFDNRVQTQFGVDGFSDEDTSFVDALGNRFSLAEVLGIGPSEAAQLIRRPESRQMSLFGRSGGEE